MLTIFELIGMNIVELALYPQTVTRWHRETRGMSPAKRTLPPLMSPDIFKKYLSAYLVMQKNFLDETSWINNKLTFSNESLTTSATTRPFTLKYVINPDDRVIFCGDLHGDVRALSSILYKLYQDKVIDDHFKIINPHYHVFFLGDLVDRGQHGTDTLTLLFMFALKNHGRVIILRGNHEDISINENYADTGFVTQLKELYSSSPQDFEPVRAQVISLYNLLPVAAFVGCNNNYFQCCHGGLEMRYNPQRLLESAQYRCLENIHELHMPLELWDPKNRLLSCRALDINERCLRHSNWFADLTATNMQPYHIGFLWNDFKAKGDPITNSTQQTSYTAGRGLMIGQTLAEKLLTFYSKNSVAVRGVIRGHQHNESMPGLFESNNRGVYSLWDNKVLTTIGTGYQGRLPAYIELTFQENFDQWKLMSNNLLPSEIWQIKHDLLKDWKNFYKGENS